MARETTVEPKKNWFLRHKFLTAILIIVVIAIIGRLGAGSDENDTAETPGSEEAANSDGSGEDAEDSTTNADQTATDAADDTDDEESEEADEPAEETASIGTTVNTGSFDVTVSSVDPGVTAIGNEYLGAEPSGQFVIVYVTVANTSNEAEYFLDSDQHVIDEQGRQHSTSSDSVYFDEAETFSFEKINPGVAIDGALVYDIPADSTAVTLELDSNELFGDTVLVSLE